LKARTDIEGWDRTHIDRKDGTILKDRTDIEGWNRY